MPFTIVEEYTPMAGQPSGLFYKTAKMPGGSLLRLATVVVDADARNGTYVLFSCLDLGPLPAVTELVVASRARSLDDAALAAQHDESMYRPIYRPSQLVCVEKDTPLRDALQLMLGHGLSYVPVTRDDAPVDVLSLREITLFLAGESESAEATA